MAICGFDKKPTLQIRVDLQTQDNVLDFSKLRVICLQENKRKSKPNNWKEKDTTRAEQGCWRGSTCPLTPATPWSWEGTEPGTDYKVRNISCIVSDDQRLPSTT